MILIGAGGLATQLTDVIWRLHPVKPLVFFDNVTVREAGETKFGCRILTNWDEFSAKLPEHGNEVVMALASLKAKTGFHDLLVAKGIECSTIIAQTALIGSQNVSIGTGSVILEHCIIESNVSIGRMCLVNTSSKLFHDTQIGDFCEIAPNSSVLGKCTIGNNVFIGANATILPGIIIGDDVVIGAGSIVTKNVESGTRVKGNPAKSF